MSNIKYSNYLNTSNTKKVSSTSIHSTQNKDLEQIIKIENNPENSPFILTWSREMHMQAITDTNIAHYKFIHENLIIGYAILFDINSYTNSINLKRLVIMKKGCGFGRQALRLLKHIAFKKFEAHRFWLQVMVQNNRAYSLYLSEGFQDEGIHRESLRKGEEYIDLRSMSILFKEYQKQS